VTKGDWYKFGSVGGCDRLEDTPWETAKNLTDEQDFDGRCEDCG
jgi:hypothetical protein